MVVPMVAEPNAVEHVVQVPLWDLTAAPVTDASDLAAGPAGPVAGWAAAELRGRQLGDRRLDRRLVQVVDAVAAQPTASLPTALGTWAATKAAYRFLANERVTPAGIRAAALPAVQERAVAAETVVLVQDTTTLNFSAHPATAGLGDLGNGRSLGLWVHSALAVSLAGVPLGLVAQTVWTRPVAETGKAKGRKQRAYADKESVRWEQTEQASTAALPAPVRTITVADREADIYELFVTARAPGRELLIRATHDRKLARRELGTLWATLAAAPVAGTVTVAVGRRGTQPERQATCTVRWQAVTLRPPRRAKGAPKLAAVTLWAVLVREEQPPAGVTPLCWQLLTTVALTRTADAVRCAEWYALRWLIERYHLVLKSGCRVEALQLETVTQLERAVAVYSLAAWRLLWLTYEARRTPDVSCEVALAPHEWQALACRIHQTPTPPATPPTLREATRWIAQLGGFLARTGDGEPGVITLWRGWRRLHDLADAWRLFHPPPHRDVGNAKPFGRGLG